MKINYKMLFIALLVLMTIITISNVTFATTIGELDVAADDTFEDAGKSVVSILTSIGIVISVVVLAFLGVKYMLGSVEERAEYKKTLMPYFIGAGLTFGASTIANIIYNFVK